MEPASLVASSPRKLLDEPTRQPASRRVLCALLVGYVRELSAVRHSYHAAVHLLNQRERELGETRARYHRLIDEYRRLRESVLRRVGA